MEQLKMTITCGVCGTVLMNSIPVGEVKEFLSEMWFMSEDWPEKVTGGTWRTDSLICPHCDTKYDVLEYDKYPNG